MRRLLVIMKTNKILALLAAIAIIVLPAVALAQVTSDISGFSEQTGLLKTDLRTLIVRIVQFILGFLGLIAVLIVMYGGWLWMSAAGNEERITKAKRVLINGLIGLGIILAAFIIVSFILNKFQEITGGEPRESCAGFAVGDTRGCINSFNCAGEQVCEDVSGELLWSECNGPTSCPAVFGVTRFYPPPPPFIAPRNVVVSVFFSKNIDPVSVSANSIQIFDTKGTEIDESDDESVSGDVTLNATNKRRIDFVPTEDCPLPAQNKKCFNGDALFRIEVDNNIKSAFNDDLSCPGSSCESTFQTNNIIDIDPPRVTIELPPSQIEQKPAGVEEVFKANAKDAGGIKEICFWGNQLAVDGTETPTKADLNDVDDLDDGINDDKVCKETGVDTISNYTAQTGWKTSVASAGTIYVLKSEAEDLDTNTATKTKCVKVFPAHCFNNIKDEAQGETGVDCGGDPTSAEFCGACAGEQCDSARLVACDINDTDCSTGLVCNTTTNRCIYPPVIYAVKPPDGASGNFITILGRGFGTNKSHDGAVTFLNGSKVADLPDVEGCNLSGYWSDTQIIVVVPQYTIPEGETLASAIEVKTSSEEGGLTDTTDGGQGELIPDFVINQTKVYPAIACIDPNHNCFNKTVTFRGQGFGDTKDKPTDKVLFGDREGATTIWSNDAITATVPNLKLYSTFGSVVENDGVKSNPINFTIDSCKAPPRITGIDPTKGPYGTYVTITGTNFGESGKVEFWDTADGGGKWKLADINLAPKCTNSWTDQQIIVKVPPEGGDPQTQLQPLAVGTHSRAAPVRVVRSPDGQKSCEDNPTAPQYCENDDFILNDDILAPGLCKLEPKSGPVGIDVDFFGEGFGADEGGVLFSPNISVNSDDIINWFNREANSIVPPGAVTGPAKVAHKTKVCDRKKSQSCTADGDCTWTLPSPDGQCQNGVCSNESALTCSDNDDCKAGQQDGSCVLNTSNGLKFEVGSCNVAAAVPITIKNPGFEKDFSNPESEVGWISPFGIYPPDGTIETAPPVKEGSHYYKFGSTLKVIVQHIDAKRQLVDNTLKVSFWARGAGDISVAISDVGDMGSSTLLSSSQTALMADKWQHYTGAIEIEDGTSNLTATDQIFDLLFIATDAGTAIDDVSASLTTTNTCGTGYECCEDGACRTTCPLPAAAPSSYRWKFSTGPERHAPRVVESRPCAANLIANGNFEDWYNADDPNALVPEWVDLPSSQLVSKVCSGTATKCITDDECTAGVRCVDASGYDGPTFATPIPAVGINQYIKYDREVGGHSFTLSFFARSNLSGVIVKAGLLTHPSSINVDFADSTNNEDIIIGNIWKRYDVKTNVPYITGIHDKEFELQIWSVANNFEIDGITLTDSYERTASPSPWKGSQDVCLNAAVSVRFTTALLPASVAAGAIKVEECATGSSRLRCISRTPTPELITGSISGPWDVGDGTQGITWTPSSDLDPNVWYKVTLPKTNGVLSTDNLPLREDYVWQFYTSDKPCIVAATSCSPSFATIDKMNGTQEVTAQKIATNCNVLSCSYTAADGINWSVGAGIDGTNISLGATQSCRNTATGNTEGKDDVKTQASEGAYGLCHLTVAFAPLAVTEYYPRCDAACLNAAIGAAFTREVKNEEAAFTSSTLKLSKCSEPTTTRVCENALTTICDSADDCGGEQCLPQGICRGKACPLGNECAADETCTAAKVCQKTANPECVKDSNCLVGETCVIPSTAPPCSGATTPVTIQFPPTYRDGYYTCSVGGATCTRDADCPGVGNRCNAYVNPAIDFFADDGAGNKKNLDPNSHYRVIIKDIQSEENKPLSGLNYCDAASCPSGADSFSWVFGTADAECKVDKLEVTPKEATVRTIGASESFFSQPWSGADECSDKGQRLNALKSDYDWNSTVPNVGSLPNPLANVLPKPPPDPASDSFIDPLQTVTAVGTDVSCTAVGKVCLGTTTPCLTNSDCIAPATCVTSTLGANQCFTNIRSSTNPVQGGTLNPIVTGAPTIIAPFTTPVTSPPSKFTLQCGFSQPGRCVSDDMWTLIGGGTPQIIENLAEAQSGKIYVHLTTPGLYVLQQNVETARPIASQKFILKFWAKDAIPLLAQAELFDGTILDFNIPDELSTIWKEYSGEITIPDNARGTSLKIKLYGPDIKLDNVTLTNESGKNLLLNGDFEQPFTFTNVCSNDSKKSCTLDADCNTGLNLCGNDTPADDCGTVTPGKCDNDPNVLCTTSNDCNFAVNSSGCCGARPYVEEVRPAYNPIDPVDPSDPSLGDKICPNSAFTIQFNTTMDNKSVISAARLEYDDTDDDNCDTPLPNTVAQVDNEKWWQRAWNFITGLFTREAGAQGAPTWCEAPTDISFRLVEVDGKQKTEAILSPKERLRSTISYRIVVAGESDTNPTGGAKSTAGIQMSPDYTWLSTPPGISDKLCLIDRVEVDIAPPLSRTQETNFPQNPVWPHDIFNCVGDTCVCDDANNGPEKAGCRLTIYGSYVDEDMMPGSAIPGNQHIYNAYAKDSLAADLAATYEWNEKDPQDVIANFGSASGQTLVATANAKDGMANAVVTAESAGIPSATNTVPITVYRCANPYTGNINDNTTNFLTTYCRDAGKTDTADDLPNLSIATPPAPQGIFYDAILKVQMAGNPDAIGIRVVKNPRHLSPLEWYNEQKFPKGSPQTAIVDGYPAIKDGRTVYVGGGNAVDGTGADPDCVAGAKCLYTNIYIISHNQGADAATVNIFNQLVKNLTLNTNQLAAGECKKSLDLTPPQESTIKVCDKDKSITCAKDGDCGANGPCRPITYCLKDTDCKTGYLCYGSKASIARDVKRVTDTLDMTGYLTDYLWGVNCASVTPGAPGDSDCNGRVDGQDLMLAQWYKANADGSDPDNEVSSSELMSVALCQGANYDLDNDLDLTDISSIQDVLRSSCKRDSSLATNYPSLSAGTYVESTTTSQWPSWKDTLSPELNKYSRLKSALPQDPINLFATCEAGGAEVTGHNANTCWAEVAKTYSSHYGEKLTVNKCSRGSKSGQICANDGDCTGGGVGSCQPYTSVTKVSPPPDVPDTDPDIAPQTHLYTYSAYGRCSTTTTQACIIDQSVEVAGTKRGGCPIDETCQNQGKDYALCSFLEFAFVPTPPALNQRVEGNRLCIRTAPVVDPALPPPPEGNIPTDGGTIIVPDPELIRISLSLAGSGLGRVEIKKVANDDPLTLTVLNTCTKPTSGSVSCPSSYDPNDAPLTLTAIPTSPDTQFKGWSGSCSGSGDCTISSSGIYTVTATFSEDVTLTINKSGGSASDGVIINSVSYGPPSQPWPISKDFPRGTTVTLLPKPSVFSEFDEWSNCGNGTGIRDTVAQSCTITLNSTNSAATITYFSPPPTAALAIKASGNYNSSDPSQTTSITITDGDTARLVWYTTGVQAGGLILGQIPSKTWSLLAQNDLPLKSSSGSVNGYGEAIMRPTNVGATAITYTYRLFATGPGGNNIPSDQVTVIVNPRTRILVPQTHFDPTALSIGGCTTLTWATSGGATSIEVTKPDLTKETLQGASGTKQYCPSGAGPKTYTLVAKGPNGDSDPATLLTVMVYTPVNITKFQIQGDGTSATIGQGQPVTLEWAITGDISDIKINGVSVGASANGTKRYDNLTVDTVYELSVTGMAGNTANSNPDIVIDVVPPPAISSFTCTSPIDPGAPVTLSWTASNATSIQSITNVTPSLYSGKNPNGDSITLNPGPSSNTTYILTLAGLAGTDSESCTVSVKKKLTVDFVDASTGNGTVTASGAVTGTVFTSPPPPVSKEYFVAQGNSVTLNAVGASGALVSWTGCTTKTGENTSNSNCIVTMGVSDVIITVRFTAPVPVINSFTAEVSGSNVTTVNINTPIVLNWDTSYATVVDDLTVTVDGVTTDISGGPFSVDNNSTTSPTYTIIKRTDFTISVSGLGGSATRTITVDVYPTVTLEFDTPSPAPLEPSHPIGSLTLNRMVGGSPVLVGTCTQASCSYNVINGQQYQVVANSIAGARFVKWSTGPCAEQTTPTCDHTITGPVSFKALYNKTYRLNLNITGSGTVTVASDSQNLSTTTSRQIDIDEHDTVALTYSPSANYIFEGWSGGACSEYSCSFSDWVADKTVNATFVARPQVSTFCAPGASCSGTNIVLPDPPAPDPPSIYTINKDSSTTFKIIATNVKEIKIKNTNTGVETSVWSSPTVVASQTVITGNFTPSETTIYEVIAIGANGSEPDGQRPRVKIVVTWTMVVVTPQNSSGTSYNRNASPQIVFTDKNYGYMFYMETGSTCRYVTTTNGGLTWMNSAINVVSTSCDRINVWYDAWTPFLSSYPGGAPSIHIAYIGANDKVHYRRIKITNPSAINYMESFDAPTTTNGAIGYATFHSITVDANNYMYIGINDGGVNPTRVLYCNRSSETACDTESNWRTLSDTMLTEGSYPIQLLPYMGATGGFVVIRFKNDSSSYLRQLEARYWVGSGSTSGADSGSWSVIDNQGSYDIQMSSPELAQFSAVVDSTGKIYLAYIDNCGNNGANCAPGINDELRMKTLDPDATVWVSQAAIHGAGDTTDGATRLDDVALSFDEYDNTLYATYSDSSRVYTRYQYSNNLGATWPCFQCSNGATITSLDTWVTVASNFRSIYRIFVAAHDDSVLNGALGRWYGRILR